jgi:hypothetical protein
MEVSDKRHAPADFAPGKTPASNKEGAGLAPQLVWKFWRREKYLTPAGIPNPDRPARSLVTVVLARKPYKSKTLGRLGCKWQINIRTHCEEIRWTAFVRLRREMLGGPLYTW